MRSLIGLLRCLSSSTKFQTQSCYVASAPKAGCFWGRFMLCLHFSIKCIYQCICGSNFSIIIQMSVNV